MALMVRKVIEAGAVLGLKPSRRAVLFVLAEHVNHKKGAHESWPSFATIMFETGLKHGAVEASIKELKVLGLIDHKRVGHNRWRTEFFVDQIDERRRPFPELKADHKASVQEADRSKNARRLRNKTSKADPVTNRGSREEVDPTTNRGSQEVDPPTDTGSCPPIRRGPDPPTNGGITRRELELELEPTNQSGSSDLQGAAADLGLVGDDQAHKIQQLCDTLARAEPQAFNKTHRALVTEIVQAGNDRHGFIDDVLAGLHSSANVGAVLTTRLQEVRDRMAQPSSVQPPAPIECTRPDCDNRISMILGPDGREFCPECHPSFVNARRRAAQRKAS